MGAPKSTWTDEMRATLRVAWCDPTVTMEEVGKRIGRSPTVARNEAQRLGLPHRAAIRPGAAVVMPPAQRPRPLPSGARTLPPLPSEEEERNQCALP